MLPFDVYRTVRVPMVRQQTTYSAHRRRTMTTTTLIETTVSRAEEKKITSSCCWVGLVWSNVHQEEEEEEFHCHLNETIKQVCFEYSSNFQSWSWKRGTTQTA